MKTILFVCTGNTCRSSMAQGILLKLFKDAGEKTEGIKVISAGTSAVKGQRASKNAILVMQEKDIDIKGHEATPLTRELVDEADLILAMTQSHKFRVMQMSKDAHNKTYTLKEYVVRSTDVGELTSDIVRFSGTASTNDRWISPDISDPFGQPLGLYRACANEIEEDLKIILKKLLEGMEDWEV